MRWKKKVFAVGVLASLAGCGSGRDDCGPVIARTPGSPQIFVGAGDIAGSWTEDEDTAQLLDNIVNTATDPVTVFTAGDNVYPDGTFAQFAQFYHPTWGRHKARTSPSPGNHDYNTAGAQGYYDYFCAAAGPAGRGYYSYTLGSWHIVSLNSTADRVAGSAQEQWLRSDLAANPAPCTLAYWHYSRFSSGDSHGNDASMDALFRALYAYGVDVLITGHDHIYERFDPQNPDAVADPGGIRAFIAGTGGAALNGIGTVQANSVARNGANTPNPSHGVLKLTLHDDQYGWEFKPTVPGGFTDSGSASCFTGTHP